MSSYDDIVTDNDASLTERPTISVTNAAGAVALALVLAFIGGQAASSRPVVQTPQACHTMAAAADALDGVQVALTEAVHERGDTLGKDDYRVKDAEVNHLLASMSSAETAYVEARGECLDGAR